MATVAEAFALALQHLQAGNLRQAELLCRQILQAYPGHADSHHLLGIIAYHEGQYSQAADSIRRALDLSPQAAVYHCNLGLAYQGQGQLDKAVACFREALRLQPDFADAHNNLGNTLCQQGNLDQAVVHFREALRLEPDCAQAHSNLGLALAAMGELDGAIDHYRHAVRLNPNLVEVHSNLGLALARQHRQEEAIQSFQQILRLNADSAAAHFNLGVLFAGTGKLEEACASFRQALELNPSFAEAHTALGNALVRQNRLNEGMSCMEEALRLNPQLAEAHWNRSVVWLSRGDFEHGWPEYEWRWGMPGASRRQWTEPLWDGSPLGGRTLLLYAEQGLGDTLQFLRYIPLARERGGKVILECPASLMRLLAGFSGVDELAATGSPLPAFDVQAPLLRMPGICRTSLATIPAAVPYLRADARLVEHWQQKMSDLKKIPADVGHRTSHIGHVFRVGIAWQGTPEHPDDRKRSIPLACFAPLAAVPGVQLISLQKGPGAEHLSAFSRQLSDNRQPATDNSWVLDLGNCLDEANGPFMDTAAVMTNVDLVISSDTAVPHLAGALAIPVWVALPLSPDWRWLRDREDSPWYPTMRLYRQTKYGQWDDVFERMVEDLKARIAKPVP
jgi:tetratricopeptide (TPR) repeat protein